MGNTGSSYCFDINAHLYNNTNEKADHESHGSMPTGEHHNNITNSKVNKYSSWHCYGTYTSTLSKMCQMSNVASNYVMSWNIQNSFDIKCTNFLNCTVKFKLRFC